MLGYAVEHRGPASEMIEKAAAQPERRKNWRRGATNIGVSGILRECCQATNSSAYIYFLRGLERSSDVPLGHVDTINGVSKPRGVRPPILLY
jgi:hypothetical protein